MATIISRDPSETLALGRSEGARSRAGDVLALCGDLGAGKTQFVKGLAEGLNFEGEVTSPTFTLIHEYAGGRLPLYHFDFYRLASTAETLALGFDDYLDRDGVTVIEWADKFPELLPPRTRWLRFVHSTDGERQISLPD